MAPNGTTEAKPAGVAAIGPSLRTAWSLYWPVRVDLATPGAVCVWTDVTPLAEALEHLGLVQLFEMELADLLAALMSPITFGVASGRVGNRLVAAAEMAGTTPSVLLRSVLATAAEFTHGTVHWRSGRE